MPRPLMQSIAFWISPTGDIYLISSSHVDYVIDHPELFQISLEALRERYAFYNEDWRCEGKAREECIRSLVCQGWIRVRRYKAEYAVNVNKFEETVKLRLGQFASKLLNEGFGGRYESDTCMPLRIRTLSQDKNLNMGPTIEIELRSIVDNENWARLPTA